MSGLVIKVGKEEGWFDFAALLLLSAVKSNTAIVESTDFLRRLQ